MVQGNLSKSQLELIKKYQHYPNTHLFLETDLSYKQNMHETDFYRVKQADKAVTPLNIF